MKTIILSKPTEFEEKIQTLLERDESANSLMLGVTQQLVASSSKQTSPGPLMITVEDDQGVTAAGLMTSPYCMILYSEPMKLSESLSILVDNLSKTSIPGVIGKKYIVKAFSDLWIKRFGGSARIHRDGRVYQLNRVKQTPKVSGVMRLATSSDFDLVSEWARDFDIEALEGEEGDAVIEHTRQRIEQNSVYLWQDGIFTAMAINARNTRHGSAVSYVYCPPALRGRGYASALVSALSQNLLDRGADFCTLMTDLKNPTSNHIYQAIGYEPVCDIQEIHFS